MPDHLKTLNAHAREALKPARQGQLSPSERIALFKRFLKIEEHRIKLRHRAGAGGLEIARARAELLDVLLSSVFKTAQMRRKDPPGMTLVATGGYGRRTLNPGSDIDLLFLLPRASTKLPKPLEEIVQEVLYLLWDVGFSVGQASRSIADHLWARRSKTSRISTGSLSPVCTPWSDATTAPKQCMTAASPTDSRTRAPMGAAVLRRAHAPPRTVCSGCDVARARAGAPTSMLPSSSRPTALGVRCSPIALSISTGRPACITHASE